MVRISLKLLGILNGDYHLFISSLEKADVQDGLPASLKAWATAKRLSIKYGWEMPNEGK